MPESLNVFHFKQNHRAQAPSTRALPFRHGSYIVYPSQIVYHTQTEVQSVLLSMHHAAIQYMQPMAQMQKMAY